MSRIDSSSNTGFKKRAHRPWKPAVLETDPQETFEPVEGVELSNEFLQKQLETSLEIKEKQQSELQERFAQFQDRRITVGGFFQPKNIFFLNEDNFNNSTIAVLKELKEKELEILEINYQLKLTQALEQVQQTENQLRAEELARQSAEEKAVAALRQAHQATEQAQAIKEKAYLSDQTVLKLQHKILELEAQLKGKVEQYQAQLSTLTYDLERSHELNRLETELRQFMEADLQKAKLSLQESQYELQEKSRNVTHLGLIQAELQEKGQQMVKLQTLLKQAQDELFLSNERALEQGQFFEKTKDNMQKLEQRYRDLQQTNEQVLNQQQHLQNEMQEQQAQIQKLNLVVEAERDLRNLYSEKLQAALKEVSALEEKIHAEAQARQRAERLAAQRMEQASQAVMQILNAAVAV